ncbi:M50 family metallopeptidase [Bacillus sp. WMMC1349]|uniref:M50 family metallopeptidase n=1 Tax=Bacillus sp. WMMC1349 TaxID=2736254 RepID=UPI001555A432|nr:M50 family metallopeptidase [Bacillus sp. WMMC1349]NPC93159.1 M50 family metallopeptidase [Bacillus sp. WMMC1349]
MLKYMLLQPFNFSFVITGILLLLYFVIQDTIFLVLIMVLFLGFFSILLHELGHLIFGKVMGMKLNFMSAWFVLLTGHPNKIKANHSLELSLGYTCMFYEDINLSKNSLKKALTLCYAGGPIISFICTAIAYSITSSIDFKIGMLDDAITYFGILNFAIAICTIVPLSSENDGGAIVNLYKSQNFFENFKIQNLYLNKDLNKVFNEHHIEFLNKIYHQKISVGGDLLVITLLLISYYHSKKQYEKAAELLKKSLSTQQKNKNLNNDLNFKILYFYYCIMQLNCQNRLTPHDILQLKDIDFSFMKIYDLVSEGIISYHSGESSKGKHLLTLAEKNLHQLLDVHQERILKNFIQGITNKNQVVS